MLSIILPSYNEGKNISKASGVISELLASNNIPYELIFVDDGSKDDTWNEIEKASKGNPNVVGIHFSRNFGKESALFAGLAESTGDACIVMDCDLQHPPETLIEMYRLWQEGYEVVEGVKRSRGKESILHKASAGLFYKLISKAVKIDMSRASYIIIYYCQIFYYKVLLTRQFLYLKTFSQTLFAAFPSSMLQNRL